MSFVAPWRLWLLMALPVILVMMIFSWWTFKKFLNSPIASCFLFRSYLPSWKSRLLVSLISLTSLALVIVGLAKPYILSPVSEKIYRNVRIVFCLDVSLSMSRSEDIKPNRLAAAKKEIHEAINSLDGIYEIGLIPFAGDANTFYCPISFSRTSFLEMLDEVDEEAVTVQGSDLVNVMVEGVLMIANREKQWKEGVNLVIILSDGGKEEGFSMDLLKLEKVVKELRQLNFRIYTIGVGGVKPTPLVRRDWAGNPEGLMMDPVTKKIYYSELDEDILKKIGNWSGTNDKGYERFEKEGRLKEKLKEIILANRILEKEKVHYEKVFIDYWFFAAGTILIWLIAMSNRKILGIRN